MILNKACFLGNEVWVISNDDSYLYKLDMEQGMLREVCVAARDGDERTRFSNLYVYKDSLLLVPRSVNYLTRYFPETGKLAYYDLPFESGADDQYNFVIGHLGGDVLYLFGYKFQGILKINLVSGECFVIDDFVAQCRGRLTDKKDGYFPINYVVRDEFLYFPFQNMNAVLELDLGRDVSRVITVGDKKQRYMSVEAIDDDFWLVPRDAKKGTVIQWNRRTNKTKRYGKYPKNLRRGSRAFYTSVLHGTKLILFADMANLNVVLDTVTGEMRPFPHLFDTDGLPGWKYKVIRLFGDRIFYLRDGVYGYYDLRTKENEQHFFEEEQAVVDRYEYWKLLPNLNLMMQRVISTTPIYENERLNLPLFIEFVLQGEI